MSDVTAKQCQFGSDSHQTAIIIRIFESIRVIKLFFFVLDRAEKENEDQTALNELKAKIGEKMTNDFAEVKKVNFLQRKLLKTPYTLCSTYFAMFHSM